MADGGTAADNEDLPTAAAYYARGTHGWRAWWTLLHPPYTLMHLSFVVFGAALVPVLDLYLLVLTLAAFFLAMGLAAHALDELKGRPLKTTIPTNALVALALVGLTGAAALGLWAAHISDVAILWLVPVGVFLVVAYNLELFGGRLHNAHVFALAWGAFPVLVAGYAQSASFGLPLVLGALFAYLLSRAQRSLSDSVRHLRRQASHVEGTIRHNDGTTERFGMARLIEAPEAALRLLVWATVVLAASVLAYHLVAGTWVWDAGPVGRPLRFPQSSL
ncbi:MAG: hypothetical protein KY455_02335 [Euryarchaeota archaeon]|nr:hypothetical protein [Euryarchaeota archaeon]